MSAKAGGGRMRVVQTNRKRVRREGIGSPLSDADAEAIVMAVMRGHYPDPVSEETLAHVLQEMVRMSISGALVDMVIDGVLNVRVDSDGELVFSKAAGKVLS